MLATRRIGEIDRGACRAARERLFSDAAVVDGYVEIYREMQEPPRLAAGASDRMAAICLISPTLLSTNPRLVKEADALVEAGHQVHVVCGDFLSWARDADLEFEGRRWSSVTRVRFGPGTPLARRFLQVFRQRLARRVVLAGMTHERLLAAAWHQATPDLVRAATAIRADLYVAHYVAALPAAAKAARLHDARYAFDAEDFHLGDPPDGPEFDGVRRHTRAIESAYLPGAAYVTAASPGIAEGYASDYGIPVPTVVLNVFPRSHAPAAPTERGSATPGPSVYWFSQTIGRDRGLECAARAIGLARSRPHLYLRGNPEAGFVDRLRSVAAGAGVADRVHLLPPERPSEMERLASRYDVGLVGETGATANHHVALTNKLFTYILAGIPIIASDIHAHRRLALRLGPGMSLYPLDSAKGLAAAIDGFLDDGGATLARAREHVYALGQQSLNWDVEKAVLVRKVEESLACRP